MFKIFRKAILNGVILIVCFGLFTSCNNKTYGDFYTLQEAYDLGYITIEDLKSIAYYQNNGLEWYLDGDAEDELAEYKSKQSEYVPTDKNPEELDSDLKSTIKNNWIIHLKTKLNIRNYKADDISITKYYGTYNGCVAIMLYGYGDFPQAEQYITIGDVVLKYSDGNSIRIWKEK